MTRDLRTWVSSIVWHCQNLTLTQILTVFLPAKASLLDPPNSNTVHGRGVLGCMQPALSTIGSLREWCHLRIGWQAGGTSRGYCKRFQTRTSRGQGCERKSIPEAVMHYESQKGFLSDWCMSEIFCNAEIVEGVPNGQAHRRTRKAWGLGSAGGDRQHHGSPARCQSRTACRWPRCWQSWLGHASCRSTLGQCISPSTSLCFCGDCHSQATFDSCN